MDSNNFDAYKEEFKELTGKNADENLAAYLSFINIALCEQIRVELKEVADEQKIILRKIKHLG